MIQKLTKIQKAYIAGFLDGDGSIYVRAKPNDTYRYGFQIAPYIVFFQSQKDQKNFAHMCSLVGIGHMRIRKDGILEYIISKAKDIQEFLECISPYIILKKKQVVLMLRIMELKTKVKTKNDFNKLLKLIDSYRELNYSKKRKRRLLTP